MGPFAAEQAALRRVATLMAHAATPEEVFAAVAAEAGQVLGADFTALGRYEPDGSVNVVGRWTAAGDPLGGGVRPPLGGRNVASMVFDTGRPARLDSYPDDSSGAAGETARSWGVRSGVGVPIHVESELWGCLFVASMGEDPLPADTEERLSGFTGLAATTIANAQARVELRTYADEQAALRRVATLVARAVSPEEVFSAVAAEVGRLLDVDITVLGRYDPDGTMTSLGSAAAGDDPVVAPRTPLGGRNVVTRVFETGRPVRMDDFSDASGAVADAIRALGVRAAVGVPISVEGRLWGVMLVSSRGEQSLPAETEARLAGFTELIATAVANAQARVEVRGFAEEQAALRRVATLVARAASPEEVFAAVTEEVGRVMDGDLVAMARVDPDGAVSRAGLWTRPGVEWPHPNVRRAPLGGRNVQTLVIETGRPARIDDYDDASGPASDMAREMGIRSSVAVPIAVEGRVWGVMTLSSTREAPLPPDTEARLTGFVELAATAIANAHARIELRGFAEEQAALRRIATQVARAAPPAEVFAAVSAEVGRLLGCDFTLMNRYDPDQEVTVVGVWGDTDAPPPVRVGDRAPFDGRTVSSRVLQTGRPVRIDGYGPGAGSGPAPFVAAGVRCAVGAPISVEGKLWGVMMALTRHRPLPADTEARLAGFTELVATAVANADSQAQLAASRARIVATADATRRRIERDLHDGAQQRLVSLALQLRAAMAAIPAGTDDLKTQLDGVTDGLGEVLEELRTITRGIHPVVLTEGGLHPALKALAHRSPLRVNLDVRIQGRLPGPVELAAYYAVAEALTNAAKHAQVTAVSVGVVADDGVLRITVRDDGRGGATAGGSGLVGLTDRVEALGGRLVLHSPSGGGTTVAIELPLAPGSRSAP